jgi:hypothetical protein
LSFALSSSADVLQRTKPTTDPGLSAIAAEPRFEFDPVVEGAEIIHEFLIENRGESVLYITEVKTGCGCTTADFSKSIQPSATGSVIVKTDTEGYGGSTLHQNIEVYTSDPFNEKLVFELTGMVRKFAEVSPRRLMIKGSVKDSLISKVRIAPAPEYDFVIRRAESKDLEDSVAVSVDRDEEGFLVTVKNRQKKPGIYVGKIILSTDNDIKPEIEIPVLMGLSP